MSLDEWKEWLRQSEPSRITLPGDLSPYLKDPDPDVRDYAVQWVAELGGNGAGQALVDGLNDPSEFVRWDAAQGLGLLRFAPAVPALLLVLRDDHDSMVRVCAVEALGELGFASPEVIGALTQALQRDRSALVKAYAAESLGRLSAAQTASVLRERLLQERSPRVRASLLTALSLFGDLSALRRLMRMIDRVRDSTAMCGMLQYLSTKLDSANFCAAHDAVLRASPNRHPQLEKCLAELTTVE